MLNVDDGVPVHSNCRAGKFIKLQFGVNCTIPSPRKLAEVTDLCISLFQKMYVYDDILETIRNLYSNMGSMAKGMVRPLFSANHEQQSSVNVKIEEGAAN